MMLCISIVSFMFMGAMIVLRNHISYSDEVLYPYIFAVCIASIYIRKPMIEWKDLIKISIFLGKISFYIYVTHYGICYMLKLLLPNRSYSLLLALF